MTLSRNGSSIQLQARLSNEARAGVVLVPEEHAQDLRGSVDLALSTPQEAKAHD